MTLLALASLLAGCRDTGLDDDRFIGAMAALRRLPAPFDSTTRTRADTLRALAADSARRAAILRTQGVTAAEMERTAEALAGDPKRAERLLQGVDSAMAIPHDTLRARPMRGKPAAGRPKKAPQR